jgi:hypothetical protein
MVMMVSTTSHYKRYDSHNHCNSNHTTNDACDNSFVVGNLVVVLWKSQVCAVDEGNATLVHLPKVDEGIAGDISLTLFCTIRFDAQICVLAISTLS